VKREVLDKDWILKINAKLTLAIVWLIISQIVNLWNCLGKSWSKWANFAIKTSVSNSRSAKWSHLRGRRKKLKKGKLGWVLIKSIEENKKNCCNQHRAGSGNRFSMLWC
jgi:hypothetical protein